MGPAVPKFIEMGIRNFFKSQGSADGLTNVIDFFTPPSFSSEKDGGFSAKK